jgi:hypothetical protein
VAADVLASTALLFNAGGTFVVLDVDVVVDIEVVDDGDDSMRLFLVCFICSGIAVYLFGRFCAIEPLGFFCVADALELF